MNSQLHQNILYSCRFKKEIETEQITSEHSLVYIQSGELLLYMPAGLQVFTQGEIGLIRRNQLVKAFKQPKAGAPFKSVALFITRDLLRKYAAENNILQQGIYSGPSMIRLSSNVFLRAFFESLLPYYEYPDAMNKQLADIKTKEIIELLLLIGASYYSFLFDFNEPYKIDLETFMVKSFKFNVPMSEFARLSGRSLSTFKRDFKKVSNITPEKWLLEKRLGKAYYLITEKMQRPSDVYLKVGFQNFSHFSTSFKDHFGSNPSKV